MHDVDVDDDDDVAAVEDNDERHLDDFCDTTKNAIWDFKRGFPCSKLLFYKFWLGDILHNLLKKTSYLLGFEPTSFKKIGLSELPF